MRRSDNRGRRVRRTLNVDLGEHANDALEECLEALRSETWRSIRHYHWRRLTRGEVIRLAIKTLKYHLHGESFPLHKAAGVHPPGR